MVKTNGRAERNRWILQELGLRAAAIVARRDRPPVRPGAAYGGDDGAAIPADAAYGAADDHDDSAAGPAALSPRSPYGAIDDADSDDGGDAAATRPADAYGGDAEPGDDDAAPAAAPPPRNNPPPFDTTTAALGAPIKSGAFGDVSWLDLAEPGAPAMVIKVAKTDSYRKELDQEAASYAGIAAHPNIANCYGIQQIGGHEGLVLEGIDGRDMEDTVALMDKLRTADAATIKAMGLKKQLSQTDFVGTLQYMMRETLKGLDHLAGQGKVHRDIRPANIMCDKITGAVKIVDFGLVTDAGQAHVSGEKVPIGFGITPPEYAAHQPATGKMDVFAAGEAARLSMEKQNFRYGATGPGVPGFDTARSFSGAGGTKRALNPAARKGAPAARLAYMEQQVNFLLHDATFQETGGAPALSAALAKAQADLPPILARIDLPADEEADEISPGVMPANQARAEAEDVLAALKRAIATATAPLQPPPDAQADAWLAQALSPKKQVPDLSQPAFAGPPPAAAPPDLAARRAALKARFQAVEDQDDDLTDSAEGDAVEQLLKSAKSKLQKGKPAEDITNLLNEAETKLSLLEAQAETADADAESFAARYTDMMQRLSKLERNRKITNPTDEERITRQFVKLATLWRQKNISLGDAETALREAESIVVGLEIGLKQAADGTGFTKSFRMALDRVNTMLESKFVASTPAAVGLRAMRDALMSLWKEQDDLPPPTRDKILTDLDARVAAEESRLRGAGQYGAVTDYTDFVNWAMNPDPANRPSAAEALRHPFLQDPLLTDSQAREVLRRVLGA